MNSCELQSCPALLQETALIYEINLSALCNDKNQVMNGWKVHRNKTLAVSAGQPGLLMHHSLVMHILSVFKLASSEATGFKFWPAPCRP